MHGTWDVSTFFGLNYPIAVFFSFILVTRQNFHPILLNAIMEFGQRPHFHLAGMVKIWIRRIITLTCLTQREDGWRVHALQRIQYECQHYFLKLFSTLNTFLNMEILWGRIDFTLKNNQDHSSLGLNYSVHMMCMFWKLMACRML